MVEVSNSVPTNYVKTADTLTTIGIRADGAAIPILAASTFSLVRPDATVLQAPVAVTLDGDDATHLVAVGDWGAGDPYGKGYVEVWALKSTGNPDEVITRPAQVGLYLPASPLSDLDLERMHSGILAEAPDGTDPGVPADPSWSGKRVQAWRRLQARLQQGIVDVTAVVSWYSFLDYLAYDALWLICWDLATEERGNGKWTIKAQEYGELRETEWGRVLFDVDRTRDGVPDTDGPSQVSAVGHGGAPGARRW